MTKERWKVWSIHTEQGLPLSRDMYIINCSGKKRLVIEGIRKGQCPICGNIGGLTSHHIVHKSMRTITSCLKELRIRICVQCHLKYHMDFTYAKICKRLAKLLMESSDEKIKIAKEFKDIVKFFQNNGIDILDSSGSEDWKQITLIISKREENNEYIGRHAERDVN